jgi:hypothetical protein
MTRLDQLFDQIEKMEVAKINQFCANEKLFDKPNETKALLDHANKCLELAEEEEVASYQKIVDMLSLYRAIAKLNKHGKSLLADYDRKKVNTENKQTIQLDAKLLAEAKETDITYLAGKEAETYAIKIKNQVKLVYACEPNSLEEKAAKQGLANILKAAYESKYMSNHRHTFALFWRVMGLIISVFGFIIQGIKALVSGQNQLINTTRQNEVREIENFANKISGVEEKDQKLISTKDSDKLPSTKNEDQQPKITSQINHIPENDQQKKFIQKLQEEILNDSTGQEEKAESKQAQNNNQNASSSNQSNRSLGFFSGMIFSENEPQNPNFSFREITASASTVSLLEGDKMLSEFTSACRKIINSGSSSSSSHNSLSSRPQPAQVKVRPETEDALLRIVDLCSMPDNLKFIVIQKAILYIQQEMSLLKNEEIALTQKMQAIPELEEKSLGFEEECKEMENYGIARATEDAKIQHAALVKAQTEILPEIRSILEKMQTILSPQDNRMLLK